MAKKRPNVSSEEAKLVVHLKPVLGMRPGVYLTVLYAFIIILILFLVFMVPGIHHYGSWLQVRTSPDDVAIYVDGMYSGATPRDVYVDAGAHVVSLQKPYFQNEERHVSVGGRLFGSWMFPKRVPLRAQLALADRDGLVTGTLGELGKWAMVDRVVPNYQIPPILEDAVDGALHSKDFTGSGALGDLLAAATGDVHNEYLSRDYLSAVADLASGGSVLSPSALLSAVTAYADMAGKYPNLTLWAVQPLSQSDQKAIARSTWYQSAQAAYVARMGSFVPQTGSPPGSPLAIGGIRFIPIPSGRFVMGAAAGATVGAPPLDTVDLPHVQSVDGFYMMDTEVTHAEYAAFIAENPEWAPGKTADLVKNGWATEDYLKDWTSTHPQDPQAYVSYYAARAFCAWLTARLPAYLTGYSARLPTEAQWEWAARMDVNPNTAVFRGRADAAMPVRSGSASSLGVYDLLGNLWEWTGSWYHPASYYLWSSDGTGNMDMGLSAGNGLFGPFAGTVGGQSGSGTVAGEEPAASEASVGAEIAVRGGSWASKKEDVSAITRGSQPPDWCTPFLGFRVVLVKGRDSGQNE